MKKKIIIIIVLILVIVAVIGSYVVRIALSNKTEEYEYGVFLGVDEESFDQSFERMKKYKVVVIDADALNATQLSKLRGCCDAVYSYINIGSLERYRDYYEKFEKLKLKEYEGWPEEYWMDVSNEVWQQYMVSEYAPYLQGKGIDGFFVDNLDVFYQYPTTEIYDGCEAILKGIKDTGLPVIVNGGDTFIEKHLELTGQVSDILSGINQEIEDEIELEYYKKYVERMSAEGADIYVLEYTQSNKIIERMSDYCRKKGFLLYVSDSLNLS